MNTIDPFETNAGGLLLVDRARGAGWGGFERGQNERRNREVSREEFTLASDAPCFDSLGEGSAYEPLTAAEVEDLYEREGEANRPVLVASWEDGRVEVRRDRSIGAAARWYLGRPFELTLCFASADTLKRVKKALRKQAGGGKRADLALGVLRALGLDDLAATRSEVGGA